MRSGQFMGKLINRISKIGSNMQPSQLNECLDDEVSIWCQKDFGALLGELKTVVAYERERGASKYQVEVELLERKSEYVHVMVAVDDGGIRAFKPLSQSFIVHRDGRVDR